MIFWLLGIDGDICLAVFMVIFGIIWLILRYFIYDMIKTGRQEIFPDWMRRP